MKKAGIKLILSVIVAITGFQVKAQDIHVTQFFAASTYLNPAFTGANVCSRFTMLYRNQWPGVKTAYQSYLCSFDHFVIEKNVGLGFLAAVDESGSGVLRTTSFSPQFAYEFRVGRSSMIRCGLQAGLVKKSINFDRLYFGDQIYRGRGADIATIENPTINSTFLDIGTGILYSYSNFWIGTSAYHINKPVESFYQDPSVVLPVRWSVHGGNRFDLTKDVSQESEKKYFSTAFHYRAQGKFDQLDVGFYYSEKVINIGVWYRGIPILKAYKPGYSNNDAVSFVFGVALEKVSIGYSYDITISKLAGNTKGAHEITMSYQFCKLKKVRKVKNKRVVYCPKF